MLEPDVITAGEFVDLTVKAMDENGNIDMEYRGDITFSIEEIVDPLSSDVVLPNNGFYVFKSSDQWQKTFSKWLTIKKKWEYTLQVVELLNEEAVNWEATIKVNQEWWEAQMWTLTVSSPVPEEELSDDRLNIIAQTSLWSTPLVVLIDGVKAQEGLSDASWNINMYVSGITAGKHVLLVQAVDLQGNVTATSWDIEFTYSPLDHSALFVWLEILPSNTVIVWDKATFKIETSEAVDSVTIKVWDSDPLPTQKKWDGQFEKELLMDEVWVYDIDLWLSVNGNTTDSEDVDQITVNEDVKKILSASYTADSPNDKVDLSRTYTWRVEFFKLAYGMNKDDLDLSLTTTQPQSTLVLSKPSETWFAQIFPVDKAGEVVWDPSEVLTIDPLRDPDPVCGNWIIEQWEECDDNNTNNADWCSAVCRFETALCGNRRIEAGEECDDGNTRNGDGCSRVCKIETSICGNGKLESWEECDDGNLINTDTCTTTCELYVATQPTIPNTNNCAPNGITLKTKQIGVNYYLYRDQVPNAQKYLIYRRDTQPRTVSSMELVWESTEPLFEYPFDPKSAVDQYAWYAVEAICDDDEKKMVGDFTKVKVWPEDTLMLILLVWLLLAGMWKLTNINRVHE